MVDEGAGKLVSAAGRDLVDAGVGELVGTGDGELVDEGAGKLVGVVGRGLVGAGVGWWMWESVNGSNNMWPNKVWLFFLRHSRDMAAPASQS